jgi:murein DD-endopeptidase MepM/ murein hydrolase activator NlpD
MLRVGLALATPFILLAASSLQEMIPPISGLTVANIHDTFNEIHNGHPHEATDIIVAKGTPVHAVTAGTIRKLFLSKPGGITVYAFDETEDYCYYYAHLDRYATGLREGMQIASGDIIGYVGTTGNAAPDAPHLHIAVFKLGPDKLWWKGTAVNPYPYLVAAVNRAN